MYKYRSKKVHAKTLPRSSNIGGQGPRSSNIGGQGPRSNNIGGQGPRSSNIGGQGEGKQIKNLKYLYFYL